MGATLLDMGSHDGSRAGRKRRRTAAAGAAVAAAVAIAVPVGLAMGGPAPRTDVPSAAGTPQVTRTPQAIGTVRVDPRTAEVGDGPGVPLIDVTGPTLTTGDQVRDLPTTYDQITPYRDGWIAVRTVEGVSRLDVLDASFDLVERETRASDLTVSPDGTRVAWAVHDGDHWSIIDRDVAGEELERPSTTIEEGPAGSWAGTIGFVSDDEVLAFQLDELRGTIATFIAGGEGVEQLPWVEEGRSASPATGMIGGRATLDDGRSCAATFNGRTRAPEPLWTDCSRTLGDFNADGSLVIAIPDGDPGLDGPRPGVSILDATTGAPLADFEVTGAGRRGVGIAEAVWEDDRTLLATYVDGHQQYVVRLGLDGRVERVAGPVANDDVTLSLRLTPGVAR